MSPALKKIIPSPSCIFCVLCFRTFSKNQQASQHLIFAHGIKYPYKVLYWKGYLADPFRATVADTPFPPRGVFGLARGGGDKPLD